MHGAFIPIGLTKQTPQLYTLQTHMTVLFVRHMDKNIGFDEPYFSDEHEARLYLERIRWPNGPVCPHCGSDDRHYSLKGKGDSKTAVRPGVWKCKTCRSQFSVTVGTLFERSHIPLHKWLLATFLIYSSKKDLSALQLHKTLNITHKTALFLFYRIQYAMDQKRIGRLAPRESVLEGTHPENDGISRWLKEVGRSYLSRLQRQLAKIKG